MAFDATVLSGAIETCQNSIGAAASSIAGTENLGSIISVQLKIGNLETGASAVGKAASGIGKCNQAAERL